MKTHRELVTGPRCMFAGVGKRFNEQTRKAMKIVRWPAQDGVRDDHLGAFRANLNANEQCKVTSETIRTSYENMCRYFAVCSSICYPYTTELDNASSCQPKLIAVGLGCTEYTNLGLGKRACGRSTRDQIHCIFARRLRRKCESWHNRRSSSAQAGRIGSTL